MSAGRWRIRKEGPKRWQVICPADVDTFDFPIACACRTFRKWSLARNFVFKRNGAK